MARDLYDKHEDVNRRIRTTEDLTFANRSVVPGGSTGRIVRVEPAGGLGLVWVARMEDGGERAFTKDQFVFIHYRGAKDPKGRRRNKDLADYDPEADGPTYRSVTDADLYGNRGRQRPLRRNTDEEIRSLERQALEGDVDAIRRLAQRASHAPPLPRGIVLRPRPASSGARNVRNFWVTLDVDGKSAQVATGPSAANGGFSLTVLMRDRGGAIRAMEVRGRAEGGRLVLEVDGETALTTER